MNIYQKIDLRYNNAHRLLPKWCYMTDIDAIEVRGTNPVAIIEYKKEEKFWEVINQIRKTNKLTWQLQVYSNIAKKLEIPVYFVGYSREETPQNYYVWKIGKNIINKYNLKMFQLFIKNL